MMLDNIIGVITLFAIAYLTFWCLHLGGCS